MKSFESLLAGWAEKDPFYEKIFRSLKGQLLKARLSSRKDGWLAGIPLAQKAAQALKVEVRWEKNSGQAVREGEEIAFFQGKPELIIKLENLVIGLIGKPSGIASAAQMAKKAAGGRVRLVCGGWKKQPFLVKDLIREAISNGGIESRMLAQPFLYLDKNYVRTFGGIGRTLKAVASFPGPKVIQVRGEFGSIREEAREAIRHGASVVMVDTGSWEDLDDVLRVMKGEKVPPGIKSAFAGGIKIKDIPALAQKGVDILDIGAAILDAPWLELSYDVLPDEK
jgi:nicotinate-nucleotide pyrophosphorylase (carboxylating)